VPDQVICVLRDDLTEQQIDQFLARNRMVRTPGGDLRMGLVGARVFRFRIADGRSVPAVIATLQNDPWGVSVQPNYLYQLSQMTIPQPQATPRYRTASGGTRPAPGSYQSMQYVVGKLQLARAHAISRGERVLIAVVDSGVDTQHPELAGGIVEDINVTDDRDATPHMHGTAMTGAIISRAQLLGVAPQASVITIRAFAPRSKTGASGTSFHIAAAIDRAVQEGARIINLSLAGPHDPYVQKSVEEAYARGVILVAAAGNNGPNAPAAYPAAYPQVIAVTATDSSDQPYNRANRGRYVAVSAPGVDVLVPAPGGAYGTTTGTSVAAAHITGIIALMLSRNPMLDPVAVRELLLRIARDLGPQGPDEQFGSGIADAYEAIMAAGPPQPSVPVAGGQGSASTQ
jgi:subtilisin family serine protease